MPTSSIVLIAAIVAFDVALAVLVVTAAVRLAWKPLLAAHPAREPSASAVRRSYQSFRVGVMNLGCSVHVAIDEEYLHMTPLRILRWLGMKPVSVPWSAIAIRKRSRSGRWITASVDGRSIMGPGWCLELADVEPEGT